MAPRPEVKLPLPKNIVLPVLMIACDRVTVSRSLDILLKSVWPPPPPLGLLLGDLTNQTPL